MSQLWWGSVEIDANTLRELGKLGGATVSAAAAPTSGSGGATASINSGTDLNSGSSSSSGGGGLRELAVDKVRVTGVPSTTPSGRPVTPEDIFGVFTGFSPLSAALEEGR